MRCVPRTTSSSWKSTASPSRVWRTSNSTASTPKLSAKSRLSIVFSRARRGAPRWPTIQVRVRLLSSRSCGPHYVRGTAAAISARIRPKRRVRIPRRGDRPADRRGGPPRPRSPRPAWRCASGPARRRPPAGSPARPSGTPGRTPRGSPADPSPGRRRRRARTPSRAARAAARCPAGCPAIGSSASAGASSEVSSVTAISRSSPARVGRLARGLEHRAAAGGVHVDHRRARARRRRDGAGDRRGDVVELQIEEDLRAACHGRDLARRATAPRRRTPRARPSSSRRVRRAAAPSRATSSRVGKSSAMQIRSAPGVLIPRPPLRRRPCRSRVRASDQVGDRRASSLRSTPRAPSRAAPRRRGP